VGVGWGGGVLVTHFKYLLLPRRASGWCCQVALLMMSTQHLLVGALGVRGGGGGGGGGWVRGCLYAVLASREGSKALGKGFHPNRDAVGWLGDALGSICMSYKCTAVPGHHPVTRPSVPVT
jgi:hypothetical protein